MLTHKSKLEMLYVWLYFLSHILDDENVMLYKQIHVYAYIKRKIPDIFVSLCVAFIKQRTN